MSLFPNAAQPTGSEVAHQILSFLRCHPDVLHCGLASKVRACIHRFAKRRNNSSFPAHTFKTLHFRPQKRQKQAWHGESRTAELWAGFCLRDFGIPADMPLESPDAGDPSTRAQLKSRASFVELWMSWKRMALALGCYQHVPNTLAEGFSGPGFLRVCRLWRRLEAWTKSNCPNVFDTLSSGADKTTMELTGAPDV